MKIKTTDKIVQTVIKKMDERSLAGQEKYKSTMYDEVSTNEKSFLDFLQDVQEELMDAILYMEAVKQAGIAEGFDFNKFKKVEDRE